jgi:hypothetical protein
MEERMGEQLRSSSYIDMLRIDWVGGTGGLLSHAPRRVQSALTLIDGFATEGITRLFQDSVFMIPHLGVLSTVHPKASLEVFEKDCLVRLGTCIALSGKLSEKDYGKKIGEVKLKMPNGEVLEKSVEYGTIQRLDLAENEVAEAEIRPNSPFRVSAEGGRSVTTKIEGGVVGVLIDGRGRPIDLPSDDSKRRSKLLEWYRTLNAYPTGVLDGSEG